MKYEIYKKEVLKHLEDYKINKLGCNVKGFYEGKECGYVLPKNLLALNFLQGIMRPRVKYHIYSNHLNSSQVMSINFFQSLRNEKFLLEILREITPIDILKESKIVQSNFKYEDTFQNNKGNFDFYIKLSTGENIYFTIKYLESTFGKISKSKETEKLPEKYEEEYENIYKEQLANSLYLKDLTKENLYNNYQIYKNISYIKSEKDYVIFLYPIENEDLVNEMNNISKFSNYFSLDWTVLVCKTLQKTKNTKYYRIYKEFADKYII